MALNISCIRFQFVFLFGLANLSMNWNQPYEHWLRCAEFKRIWRNKFTFFIGLILFTHANQYTLYKMQTIQVTWTTNGIYLLCRAAYQAHRPTSQPTAHNECVDILHVNMRIRFKFECKFTPVLMRTPLAISLLLLPLALTGFFRPNLRIDNSPNFSVSLNKSPSKSYSANKTGLFGRFFLICVHFKYLHQFTLFVSLIKSKTAVVYYHSNSSV